jgi:hypothetical protein
MLKSVVVRHRYRGILVNAESRTDDTLGSKTLEGMLYCIRCINRLPFLVKFCMERLFLTAYKLDLLFLLLIGRVKYQQVNK